MLNGQPGRNFGVLLRRHRVGQGLSQEELAALVCPALSVDTISKLERGLTCPYRHTLESLCRALNLGSAEQAELEQARRVLRLSREPESASSKATVAPSHNLPAELSSFIGRERSLHELHALLRASRLVTLTGIGGVGKTRLAFCLAEGAVGDYPDGVCLVQVAPLSDPALVVMATAIALGVREQAGVPLLRRLIDAVQPRRLLLVLDNCEHLVAACADMAASMLQGCPHLTILATSRQPLGVPGERVWSVPPLSLPNVSHDLTGEEVLESEAVQLFLDRAMETGARLAATSKPQAVAQVCAHLDGIPLAIELAAARVHMIGIDGIASRLGDRFQLLVGGSRTAPERQHTLRATLDWSYELLSDAEQRLLDRLSVFAGGWTLAAAEGVCATDGIAAADVLDLLTHLVDRSLVIAEPDESGSVRYRLLETMRLYGRERLAGREDTDKLADQHAAYYLRLVEDAEADTWGPQAQAVWQALDTEVHNLRGALRWLIDRRETERALRLGGTLVRFWQTKTYFSEGRAWNSELLSLPGSAARTMGRSKVLAGEGHLSGLQGEYPVARAVLDESLSIAREVGDQLWLSTVTFYLGQVLWQGFEPEAGLAIAEEGVRVARAAGSVAMEAMNTYNVGAAALGIGDYPRARANAQESLRLWTITGYTRGIGVGLQQLGRVAYREGDLASAEELLEQSIARFRESSWPYGVAWDLATLGWVATDMGAYGRAREAFSEALALFRDVGSPGRIAECLEGFGQLAVAEGRPARAQQLAAAAAAVRARIGAPLPLVDRTALEPRLRRAQQMLGRSEAAAAWAAGESMSLEQAIDEALSPVVVPLAVARTEG
jgi:predicted ATPase